MAAHALPFTGWKEAFDMRAFYSTASAHLIVRSHSLIAASVTGPAIGENTDFSWFDRKHFTL
jgi:hypothetical protein